MSLEMPLLRLWWKKKFIENVNKSQVFMTGIVDCNQICKVFDEDNGESYWYGKQIMCYRLYKNPQILEESSM